MLYYSQSSDMIKKGVDYADGLAAGQNGLQCGVVA